MKIEGQNLGDVLRRMPWQYKIVVTAGTLFILYALVYFPYVFIYLRLKPKLEPSEPITVISAFQVGGMLDPSVVSDPQSGKVWMAFTSQEKAAFGSASGSQTLMNVRLASAKSASCKTWETTSRGSLEGKNDQIIAPDGKTILRNGSWRVETPTLVHDPDDAGKEWKLFAYKYFWANDPNDVMSVARHYSVIVYRYASDPTGDWSPEQWLFSSTEGFPPPPYQQTILLHLNRLDPGLQDVTAYGRPSAVYKDGVLTMTLSAFTTGVMPDRVIMIASHDHGNSWRYIGTVLRQADVSAIDGTGRLEGGTLLEQDGHVYLAAVLGNEKTRGLGTFIFGFEDFSKGRLQRDPATGVPAFLNQVPLQVPGTGTIGGGAAGYSEGCKAGMLVTAQTGVKEEFTIYRTPFKPINRKQGEK